ncbi:SWI/SNF complex component SNF12 homolog [Aristolochia californica]|uniref:SWI/SNF complex component SNF12 homolog n=1 Tax=Aristolochia californica TaxID=171875 RepID=UPI0035DCAFD5
MAANNNNQPRNPAVPSPLGNPAMVPSAMTMNQLSHLRPPSQSQTPGASHFQNQFQSSLQVQAQYQAQMQAQAQALSHNQNAGLASSPSLSTPGTANAKRASQKPPARPPGTTAVNAPPPFRTTELTPAARRKKQKLPEKQLPDRVAALLPESALYTQLVDFEARVDAALSRKKIDIQESLKNPPCIQKTLRIYVFNTYANQTRNIPEKPNLEPPSWSLKIIGKILEDAVDADAAGGIPKPSPSYPKFSSFFKRITITLDPMLYPDNPTILWEHARSPALHEGFEIKRKGDKEFVANVRLEMNYVPEKFKLSPPLMEVLGIEVDTRPRIIAAIWHYVKAKKLQNPSDPSYFACDQPLRKVFGEEKMKFSLVSQKISSHLSPPQPIHLEHRIKLSGNQPAANACYDVVVDIPFPIQREMSAFLANTEKHKEIVACDEAICAAIKKIHEHRKRRAFFLGFSQSPVEFINALIASQSRDLRLVAGEASRNAEKERRSDFYNQPWVEDAVIRYLNRKPAGGNDAPGST